ncbi:hypothetical protein D9M69_722570 [compost metagenome]
MWASNHEFSSRIDMVLDFIVEQMRILRIIFDNSWNQDFYQIFFDSCKHFRFFVKIIMLCRNYDSINPYRLVVVVIF